MTDNLIAITARLATINGLYVDEDNGQLDDYSPNFPVKWPCCLIDIASGTFEDIGPDRSKSPVNRQEGTLLVSFKFANLKMTNSSAKAPLLQKQQAWSLHTVIKDAHELLQGFRPVDTNGKLIRVRFARIKRDDGVQEYDVVYSLGMHNV